ncbi:phosphatase PAP2 family protein [Flavobacterium johnsoniae]|uniref:Phosphoesterase, PA-phosphatase related n=1 Tax=Flavobacterium johnsoniae (strain ATCC 17061 / DSM 2064 / JCM 8514 / BCRC 14874 / CCUG 350202 / NBRC 14942 / NCIMB 11054 / UW101) TaxID=376686 RepID=A5FBF6_FLAJ1|nr:phosphatase PAP2 family protein [Flavobacterium johnsoniae]ABQ07470.1 phosphoesterase, PA-phosphatase related [Flavobacterium johnsoniae UW101]OXE99373.1 PA-phosphatase [Flavobacterium johnsoniae UW101]WQG80692.1 phosphatase PAP2 family protein [Flavobacterium johnsoniae UW101]SHL12037.1 PAP2 superfamily protein [Flavobacterium johnsoniae]
MKRVFLIFLLFPTLLFSQNIEADSSILSKTTNPAYQFSTKKLIIPTILVSYGVLSLMSDGLKTLNQSTRHESKEHILPGAKIDNYMQYAPAIAVYGLNLSGVKGKHNFKDRTIIYATSQLISAAMVLPTKQLVGEERPDGSSKTSFPSGHTATAFSSAHFMFREYNETNFWLGISGYPIAAMTGIYRIFNDKHWVGDVIAGAGIGILSTEVAYWLFPTISKWFANKKNQASLVILPTYQTKQFGLAIIKTF